MAKLTGNTLLYLIMFCGCTIKVTSQTCCSGGIPLSNNLGMDLLAKQSFQLGVHYDYNNLNTLNVGTEKLDDNSRLRVTHAILLNASYSITDRLAIESLLTWVNQRRNISHLGNENLDQSSGIGDAVLLTRYNFPGFFGAQSDWSVGFGTKIPLGSSTQKNDEGITLNSDLQPGSNSWDLIYWSSFSKQLNWRPSLSISGKLIVRDTGTNDSYFETSSYKFGDELQAYLSFSDQFLFFKTMAIPGLSIKYRQAAKDKINGFDLDNTGGNWVSLIPSVAFNINSNIAFVTKAELPLYSNVDGTQLTPSYRITTGVLFKFVPKKHTFNLNL